MTQVQVDRAILCYAEVLKPRMTDAVKLTCYGCRENRPSQHEHDVCLMMDDDMKTEYCWHKALKLVPDDVLRARLFRENCILYKYKTLRHSFWFKFKDSIKKRLKQIQIE